MLDDDIKVLVRPPSYAGAGGRMLAAIAVNEFIFKI